MLQLVIIVVVFFLFYGETESGSDIHVFAIWFKGSPRNGPEL